MVKKDVTGGLFPVGSQVCWTTETLKSEEYDATSWITRFGTVSGYTKKQILIEEVHVERERIMDTPEMTRDKLTPIWGSYPTTIFGRAVHHGRFSSKYNAWFTVPATLGANIKLYDGEPGMDIRQYSIF